MLSGIFAIGGIIGGIISVAAGVIILVWPRILAYVVGIYFILIGLTTLIVALR